MPCGVRRQMEVNRGGLGDCGLGAGGGLVTWYAHFVKFAEPLHGTPVHFTLIKHSLPWLVWLSGLSADLRTKGSQVQFLVRAHAWVVGQVPSKGACERQPQIDVSFSLSFFLPPFPSL